MDTKPTHPTRSQRLFDLISTPLRLSVKRRTEEISSSQIDGKEVTRHRVTISRQLSPLGVIMLLLQLIAFLIWFYYRLWD
ncbi:MAG TPA: hypothetical protein VGL38_01350 [bacterium]|jgi:hypothetical protein